MLLILDFLSKTEALIIIFKSTSSMLRISSIIPESLLVILEIIIIFLSSNKDLFNKIDKNSSLSFRMSCSSYFKTSPLNFLR